MAKRRKKRIDFAVKVALLVGLAFIIAVPTLISVMVKRQERQYEEFVARQEAERQYLMDLSWIDSDLSLTWLADEYLYEQDAEGEWEYTDSKTLLRSYDFASGVFSDIQIESNDGYGAALVPADDPRGYVLAEEVGDYWSIFRIDENGEAVRLLREKNEKIRDILAFYGGKLYCRVYTSDAAEDWWVTHLVSWDSETKETHQYREEALCISPDGRAVIGIERDTGLFETYYSWYDDAGKPLKQAEEKQRKIQGWTLGVEDAQGNWTPWMPIGQDSSFASVSCAAWLDENRLLFAASQPDTYGKYELYIYTPSTGETVPFCDANGEPVLPYDDSISYISVSPDGRYIAYQVEKGAYKDNTAADIIVQSLETGRCAQICPRDAQIEGTQKTTIAPDFGAYQIWTQ